METDYDKFSLTDKLSFWQGIIDGWQEDGVSLSDRDMMYLKQVLFDAEKAVRSGEALAIAVKEHRLI